MGVPPKPPWGWASTLEGILQHKGVKQLVSCWLWLLNVQTGRHPKDASNDDENGWFAVCRDEIDRLTLLNSQNHIFHRNCERNAVYREDKNGDFWTILPPIYGTFFEMLDSRAIVPVIGDTSWNEDQDCNIHLFSCRRTIPPGECVNIRSWSESKHFYSILNN